MVLPPNLVAASPAAENLGDFLTYHHLVNPLNVKNGSELKSGLVAEEHADPP
jgi:hypothetical protein